MDVVLEVGKENRKCLSFLSTKTKYPKIIIAAGRCDPLIHSFGHFNVLLLANNNGQTEKRPINIVQERQDNTHSFGLYIFGKIL